MKEARVFFLKSSWLLAVDLLGGGNGILVRLDPISQKKIDLPLKEMR